VTIALRVCVIRATSLAPEPHRANDAAMEPAAPPRPDRQHARPAGTWLGIAVALAFGVFTDAVIDGPPGLGITLGAVLAAAALVVTTKPRAVAWPFLGAALAICVFLTVRASPVLAALDVAAVAALLVVAAGFAKVGEPGATTVRAYAARTVVAPVAALPDALASLAGPAERLGRSGGPQLRTFARAVAWSAPVVVVLVLLFGSADPVFARYAGTPLRLTPDAWPAQAIEVAIGAIAIATLLAVPARSLAPAWLDRTTAPVVAPFRTAPERTAILAATTAVFAAFVVVQFAVFFGGRTHVLEEQGLTFAAYARSGFWELLLAAAIAAAAIAATWSAMPRPPSRRDRLTFVLLAVTLIALVSVVLVSAFRRLTLYEEAFGFTWNRLLGHLAVVVLAALLGCAVVAVVTGKVGWLPTAAVVLAVVATLALNAMDPERFIAEHNLDRAASGAPLDVRELGSLSADAIPAIVAGLSSLRPQTRVAVEERLACTRDELAADAGRGWPSANAARARALRALHAAALGPCPQGSVG
jgi:hypothetical protein